MTHEVQQALVCTVGLLTLLSAPNAPAHGGQPIARALTFPSGPGFPWVLTDNQGLYANSRGGFDWLCEDAVARDVGFKSLVVLDPERAHWLVETDFGLYRTRDAGCSFEPLAEPLGGREPRGLWPHPDRPLDLLVGLANPGPGGAILWRSVDGGANFAPVGVGVIDRIDDVIRGQSDAELVYVAHAQGLARSDDGGETFEPLDLAALDVPPGPGGLTLLRAAPGRPDELWVAVERFPTASVMRSIDRGRTFTEVFRTDDAARALVFDAAGQRGLLTTWLGSWYRTDDGGETFTPSQPVVQGLGCLTLEPGGTDVLFGCTNIYAGGPWVVGTSADFGLTWTSSLKRFQDVRGRWACPTESATAMLCASLCPGEAFGAVCTPDVGPSSDSEVAAPADGTVSTDGGAPGDEAAEGDAAATSAETAQGCGVRGPRSSASLVPLVVLLVWTRGRRRTVASMPRPM